MLVFIWVEAGNFSETSAMRMNWFILTELLVVKKSDLNVKDRGFMPLTRVEFVSESVG
jgi:hypothetical protein